MFSVRMLGVLTMSIDGKRIVDDLGPSGRKLAGFLFGFVGRVHRREWLVDQFWGHLDPERGRAALNTALWRIRKLLGQDPLSERGQSLRTNCSEVVLERARWLEIDTLEFAETIKRLLDQHLFLGEEAEAFLEELERATGLYTGPFMEGADGDWILEERERLHSLYVRASRALMRQYAWAQRYDEAIAVVRRVLTSDPFRESFHQDLLALLLLNGQRGAALWQHERWTVLLRQELGINPMPETQRLVEEIRSGHIFERIDVVRTQHFAPRIAKSSQASRELHH
jgi:DNA-binding SARP family transcriptional activator